MWIGLHLCHLEPHETSYQSYTIRYSSLVHSILQGNWIGFSPMGISSALTALVTTCPWIFDLTSEMCLWLSTYHVFNVPKAPRFNVCPTELSTFSSWPSSWPGFSGDGSTVGSKFTSKKLGHCWVSVFLSIPLSNPPQVPCVCPPKQVGTRPLPIAAAISLVQQTCFPPAQPQFSPNPSPCGLDLLQWDSHSAARSEIAI